LGLKQKFLVHLALLSNVSEHPSICFDPKRYRKRGRLDKNVTELSSKRERGERETERERERERVVKRERETERQTDRQRERREKN
jgi:hypothetical protein